MKAASSTPCARSSQLAVTPADRLLDKFENEWHGDVNRIYSEFSF